MTRVEFFFNVEDKLAKIADLSDKAVRKGRQLTIFTEDESLHAALESALWQHCASSFLPSAQPEHENSQWAPIIIDSNGSLLLQDDILINLRAQHPPFFSRFKHLVELVGADEADKVAARARYKFYRDRGYEVKSTDMTSSLG